MTPSDSGKGFSERHMAFLEALMAVASVGVDADRLHDGEFKSGIKMACEEITERIYAENPDLPVPKEPKP